MVWQQVMDMLELLIIVVAMLVVYRAVPVVAIRQLIEQAHQAARSTPTAADDALVKLIDALWSLYEQQQQLLRTQQAMMMHIAQTKPPTPTTDDELADELTDNLIDDMR